MKIAHMTIAAAALAVLAGPAAAESWRIANASATTAYLVDMDSMGVDGDAGTLRVARVRFSPAEAGDKSHSVDHFAIRCDANESRVNRIDEVGPDGVTAESYDEDVGFDAIPPNSFDATVKAIVCDMNVPAEPSWPTVLAYMEAGRPRL